MAHAEAPTHTNRLAQEQSPYLLQHAHNPVDWYPWSTDAFERARDENKPIFLSVGYSTCHCEPSGAERPLLPMLPAILGLPLKQWNRTVP